MIEEIDDDNTDEQHYFITPPTMFLPPEGLRITVIGIDDIWTEQLGDNLENTIPNIPITFYHLDSTTANQWEWQHMMAEHSDLVMVNLEKCTQLDLITAMTHAGGNKLWIYANPETVDKSVVSLLNTINANLFFNESQLIDMLRAYLDE